MAQMRRISIAVLASVAALALVLPAVAPATLTEVGVIGATTPATVPSCPGSGASNPCLAVSRTTGFQVKVGSEHNLLSAPRAGTIVAWTISLGSPQHHPDQVLRRTRGRRIRSGDRDPRAAAQTQPHVQARRAEPARQAAAVLRQDRAVPARNDDSHQEGLCRRADRALVGAGARAHFGSDTSWRASRPKSGCSSTSSETTQTTIGSAAQYYCLYQTARLTYSATLISTP